MKSRTIVIQRITTRLAILVAFAVLAALPASAQMMGGTGFGDIGGNRLQRDVGTYSDAICGGVQGSTGARGALALACLQLQETANQILGNGDPIDNSLGLTESEINDVADDIAHRQLPATAKSSSEIAATHTATVSQRLYTLRRDWGSDVMIAGALRDDQGNTMPIHYQWSREDSAAGVRDLLPEGVGVYLNGVGGFGHRDSDNEEIGFDFRNLGFTLGSDYRLNDSSIVGGAFTYLNAFQDFNGNKGEIDVNTTAFSAYAAHRMQAAYVNVIATYAHAEVDIEREISVFDQTAKGDTSTDEFAIALGSGYEFEYEGLTYGPMIEAEWVWLDIRGFNESGANGLNLKHSHDSMKSATVDVGLEGSFPISTDYGVLVPQFAVAWAHQFEDNSRRIRAFYKEDNTDDDANGFSVKTASPDRNYAKISAALSAQLKDGVSAFGSYQALVGHNRLSLHAFTFGARLSF